MIETEELHPFEKRYRADVDKWEEYINSAEYKALDSEDDYEVIEQEDGELIPISGPELVELDNDTFTSDESMEEIESDTDTISDTEDFPWHIPDKEMERQRIALEHYNLLWFGEKYPDVNPRQAASISGNPYPSGLVKCNDDGKPYLDVHHAVIQKKYHQSQRKPKRISRGKWTYPPTIRLVILEIIFPFVTQSKN